MADLCPPDVETKSHGLVDAYWAQVSRQMYFRQVKKKKHSVNGEYRLA